MSLFDRVVHNQLQAQLESAAQLIFDERGRPHLPTYALRPAGALKIPATSNEQAWNELTPEGLPPSHAQWAVNLTELIEKSEAFRELIKQCIPEMCTCLKSRDPVEVLKKVCQDTAAPSLATLQRLENTAQALLADPEDPRWITVFLFTFSGVIGFEASAILRKNPWTPGLINGLLMEYHFSMGNQKMLRRLIVEKTKRDWLIGSLAITTPLALAKMAEYGIDTSFFD